MLVASRGQGKQAGRAAVAAIGSPVQHLGIAQGI